MERVLHFVLLVSIAVSCYSYSHSRRSAQFEPESPSANEYPAKYINKLVDALSTKQKAKFFGSKVEMEHRFEDLDHTYCKSYENIVKPTVEEAAADDQYRAEYYVVNTEKYAQNITIWICEETSCYPNATKFFGAEGEGAYSCCVRQEEIIKMQVLSVPVEEYKKRNDMQKENVTDTIIEIDLFLKTKCSCIGKQIRNKQELTCKDNL